MPQDQVFVALDLELNNLQNGQVPKIIEVGVAIGSPERGIIDKCSWLLDPKEPINPFITELTGITDQMISERAVTHEVCAQQLAALLSNWHYFRSPVTWGQGDLYALVKEFKEKNVPGIENLFGRRIIDVKTIYTYKRITKRQAVKGGLGTALKQTGLSFAGTAHSAADDAKNTLLLFFALIQQERNLRTAFENF